MDPPHPISIETRLYRRPSVRPTAVRRLQAVHCGQSEAKRRIADMRRFASLFGEMLLYQHQRIVTMTKVYIASNNLPVEIIRFHTIYDDFSDKVDLKLDNNNGFIADRSFRTMVISTSQLHYFMLLCRTESRYKRQFGSNSLLFTAYKTV